MGVSGKVPPHSGQLGREEPGVHNLGMKSPTHSAPLLPRVNTGGRAHRARCCSAGASLLDVATGPPTRCFDLGAR